MNRQVTSNDTLILKTNKGASSKENVSVLPLMQPTHNVRSSQETLYEVKRRLQSLHNVLQTYQDMNQSLKRQVSAGRVNGNDASVELDTNHDINTKKNVQTQCPSVDSCEYFDLNQSEESLSSLAKYSSTSKVCQCSSENVISQTCSKDLSRHNIRKSRNNLPALGTTEPYLRSCNAALNMSNDYENEYKKIAYERNNSDCSHELESGPKINKNIIKIDTLLKIQDNISETVSDKIYYILSPENKNIQIQNRTSPRFVSEKFNDIIDKNEYQENAIISQNSSQSKTSNDSNNKEEKSTALLLQEALHFKNALLIQSKKKYPINNVKQNDTADEFLSEPNNNFPSMIVDIKAEKPIINSSHDKIDEHYIYLQMKQRCDLSSQSLKKLDTFAHCENERDMKNQNHIPETSSEYFSITDFAIHGNAEIENNVSSNPPIYEKVISITLPVDVKDQGEINNINEKSKQTILPNTQTRVNLRENFRDDAASDNDVNKHSPAMLKLEDLIIERIKNIRDYMDDFLQSQNIAIFKARKALRYKSDNSRCSAEVSRKVTRDRLTVPFSCKNNDPMVFSKNSSDSLTNTQPNYKQEYDQETDAVLKRPSDVYLKRNPGMLALITPIKNKFSKNDARQLKVFTELKKADKSPPITLIHSTHKNDSKPAHKITNVFTPCYEGHAMQNTESDEINKVIIAENSVNMDFHKEKQIQINENKSSAMSYFPVSITKTNAKVVHTANEEYVTKSNYNSICHSNPYFTNEKKGCENNKGGENGSCIFEVIKDVKMDYVSLKSTTNIQNEVKQDAIKQQITEDKYPNANITSNKLPSDIEYSNMTIFIDSDLIFNKSKPDYLTNAKTASPLTKLKEDDITFDPDASLLSFSSEKQDKTLNIDNVSLNSLKQNKISADIEHLPSRMEDYSTKSFQTDSEMKAKSDISLITSRNKDLNINLYPKKSHSFLMHHDTMKYIDDISPQSHTKLYDIKSKLQFTSQSKSIIPLQRVSTKSCIPILKNRLESSHRMKHRAQARSPARSSTRSPLTMLWGEKTCTKDHTTDEEVARRGNTSINKHLCAEEMLNLIKLNTEQDTKELEKSNTTCRNNDIIPKENLQILPDRNIESLAINEKYSNKKRDIYESKSDTNIMQHIEKIASKEIAVISIIANDSLQKKYPVNLFILNTENICPATDFLIYKNKLWTINVKKTKKEVTEKEVMAKPSITDTCTSISDLK
ncbi:uncharacterized protein LOC112552227 [Pogonomyrmex barbatus]|uniref:Uncharacterized protein LOC112552227 n=1 Tax=Pogonomyrmex barbatus TaxID=144034 RepID=A0A8N1S2K1_9HYME|nr:uncharacterized protein LOC112552227 [Pogonomyrmex barbatus]